MNRAARALDALVVLYQRLLSPWFGGQCRFLPSCSEYARMAIAEWGAARGAWLTVRRIGRCHPFHAGGFDLPPRRSPGSSAEAGPVGAHR